MGATTHSNSVNAPLRAVYNQWTKFEMRKHLRIYFLGLNQSLKLVPSTASAIRGHVFCSFLALLLKQELESRMKQADLEWEWKEVIRGLDALQQVEANFQGRRFLFRTQLIAHASQAVRATGVAIPPTLRELQ
jgi:hypothetical protein